MNRRGFLRNTTGVALASWAGLQTQGAHKTRAKTKPFDFDETSIVDLAERIRARRLTSVQLTKAYLRQIEALDRTGPKLNAVIELNPDALAIAAGLDARTRRGENLGPLHGIPMLVKDNIDTGDRMSTSAGSLALANSKRPHDAPLVARLRAAGAVILGKTNLSEWANFRGAHSISGWSGRGGRTKNPYALNRNPSGSSSGSAVAVSANLCAAAIGTETDGSILSPASYNGIVGLKPTVGLISGAGIIPISKSQDTAGPMTRTVSDTAVVLTAISEKGLDYRKALLGDGLNGARIGVARKLWSDARIDPVFNAAVRALQNAGATVIDPIDLNRANELRAEGKVLRYEFKDGINAYLRQLDPLIPVHSLAELIAFNEKHRDQELRFFGQEELIAAQQLGPLTDAEYLEAKETCRKFSSEAIDAALAKDNLDAIIAPTSSPAHVTDFINGDRGGPVYTPPLAAIAGYPSITVPMGFIQGLPVGISFFSRAWEESKLLKIAHGFEQATKARRPPTFAAEI